LRVFQIQKTLLQLSLIGQVCGAIKLEKKIPVFFIAVRRNITFKIRFIIFMKKYLQQKVAVILGASLLAFFNLLEMNVQAQPMIVFDSSTGFSPTNIPFISSSANRRAWIYNPSDFANSQPGFITRIYMLSSTAGTPFFGNLIISMGPTIHTSWPSFSNWPTTGMIQVLNASNFSPVPVPYSGLSSSGTWMAFDLQTPYYFDNLSSIIVDIQQTGANPGFGLRETAVSNASIFGSATGTPSNFINLKSPFGFDLIPPPTCTSPPVIGAAKASSNLTCAGGIVQLSVDSFTTVTGQTYMWQSSPDGITWNNMPLNILPNATVTVLGSTLYRLSATCNGVTGFSAPVQIDVITGPLAGGTYTVNAALPSQGTNFSNLANFATLAKCAGISGPIVLNVVPGSGPYNGQIIFDNINTSAVNTITINGNGAHQTFNGGTINDRATIHLKGTSFVTIDSLNVGVENGADYGIAIQLSSSASNVTIKNCTLTGNLNSNTTNFATLVIGGGPAGITSGGGISSNVLVENNEIIGGFYSVTVIGATSLNTSQNNQIINNRIRDYHSYGIYSLRQEDFEYSQNEFSRFLRPQLGNHYGIYFTQQHLGGKILKNAIHDPFPGQASLTNGEIYGLYINAASGNASKPNLVANNIFYNLRSNGRMIVIFHTGSNQWRYHHNTIDINDSISTVGQTSVVSFTGASANILFTNNIISFRRSGSGTKNLFNIAGVGGKFLNNNGYYIHPLSQNTNFGFQGIPLPTIADWRATTTFDMGSVLENPHFVSASNGLFQPTAGAYDNIGQNLLSLVPDDFLGTARSTAPDPGAFEFIGPPCGNPVNFAASAVTINSMSLGWTQPGTTVQWNLEWGTPGYTPGSGSASTALISSNPHTITGLTPGACYDVYIRANCIAQGAGTGAWVGPLSVCLLAQYDLKLETILSPLNFDCGIDTLPISVRIKNDGLLPISGFSFTANISGAITQTLNSTYTGSLAANAVDSMFIGNVNLLSGGAITVDVIGNYTLDQVLSNNALSLESYSPSNAPSNIVAVADTLCDGQLSWLTTPAKIGRKNRWLDANDMEIGTGDSLLVGPISAPTFVKLEGVGRFIENVGPKDTTFSAAANLTGIAGQRLFITTLEEVTILQAKIYPNNSGNLIIVMLPVAPTTGPIISKSIPVAAPSSPGMPVVIPIDLTVPAGTYTMGASGASTVGGLLRNSDSASYPYGNNSFIITGNSFSPAFHYFYYDIVVATQAPCQIPADSIVLYPAGITFINDVASTAGLTSTGYTVNFDATGSFGNTFSWNFGDGGTGSGITTTHTYFTNGTYTVSLVVDGDCGLDSISQTVIIEGIGTTDLALAKNLQVFPNPTTGEVQISLELAVASDVYLRILNPIGQQIMEKQFGKTENLLQYGFDLSGYAMGVYLLQIQTEAGIVTRRIVLQ